MTAQITFNLIIPCKIRNLQLTRAGRHALQSAHSLDGENALLRSSFRLPPGGQTRPPRRILLSIVPLICSAEFSSAAVLAVFVSRCRELSRLLVLSALFDLQVSHRWLRAAATTRCINETPLLSWEDASCADESEADTASLI